MRKIDKSWLIAGLALILLIGIAIILNLNFARSDAEKIAGTIDTDNGDLKINWEKYPNYDISLNENLEITESGTYHLTGELEDGYITVKANHDTSKIRLILDNTTIRNSSGPAIACYSADDLIIELVGENYLEDSAKYSAEYDEDVTGAIYSKDDLTFQGEGELTIVSNYQDAIVGKDDLKFNSGIYYITAADDGIRGKDSVYIVNGVFNINSKGDGIKSTNETEAGKGFVLIENGNFNIDSGAKGIKAINSILIHSGEFSINSYDDAIHSNNYTGIIDGDYIINSGDDGIHADKELIIDGGNISIIKSYEGLEAQAITINGGKISIFATDDGINAGGGADNSANNRPGAGAFDVNTDCILSFNDGEVYINAVGDGVDSNGYIYFNGATVTIDGPTNNGNGALDSGANITMNGGKVIAVGSNGMAETLGQNSTINNIGVYFSSTLSANTKITIKNNSGETILEHTTAKVSSHLAAGTELFKTGEKYTIYMNNEKYTEFTISGVVTTIGTNLNHNQNVMPGRQ